MGSGGGNPSDLVSLPQGGGALGGLGETFSPDLFTGTGNFTVPIAIPQGRNGVQPALSLVYSTGNGNGAFGLGWKLGVPGIARKTAKGIPTYDDTSDIFVLSGAEDLVAVAGSLPGVMRYRPRTEGLFARIEYHRDAESSFWQVRTKDGLQSTYGAPGIPAAGAPITGSPDAPGVGGVFAWHLSETRDPFGNRVAYEYIRESATEGGHNGTQTYLSRVRYIDLGEGADTPFLVSVDLDYGTPEAIRPDPFSDHRAGFEIRTLRRCRRITVTTHVGTATPSRTYSLTYLDELVASGARPQDELPPNGVSLLARVRVTGHAADPAVADQQLPALDFSYTGFDPEARRFRSLTGHGLPAAALSHPHLELVDLDGDGLPDFLETNGVYRYWTNLGGGRFDLPRTMPAAPAGVTLGQRGVSALDMDGDGRLELAVLRPDLSGYFRLDAEGRFDRAGFRRVETAPPFDLADPEVRLLDLDGDGVTDAVHAGSEFECAFADPEAGWRRILRRPRGAPGSFPDVSFRDPRVRLADMTGDGLQDIVLVHDRNIEYWPNLGHGRWGARVTMRDAPQLPHGYDPRQVLLGDVDGDGCADLVFVAHGSVSLWVNRTGNTWGPRLDIPGTPPLTNQSDLRLVDLLGSGTVGVLWSDVSGVAGSASYRFLDLTGGTKPYLLSGMDNNMGAATAVTYRSSCEDYLRDRERPETRWRTTLPMPVQVVGRVEVSDHFSGGRVVTEYAYHHGSYDGGEREYVGFGCVDVRDAELETGGTQSGDPFAGFDVQLRAPPTLTRTWFELGPVGPEHGDWREVDLSDEYWDGDPSGFPQLRADRAAFFQGLAVRRERRDALRALRGAIVREEYFALAAVDERGRPTRPPYTVREVAHLVRHESPADAGRPIFFAFEAATRNTRWEEGSDPLTIIEAAADHDAYGQPRARVTIGCPRGWQGFEDPRIDFLAKLSRTQFAQRDDDAMFIVDRTAVAEEHEVRSADGAPASLEDLLQAAIAGTAELASQGEVRNFYDGEAFAGLPLGQLGAFGALVRSEMVVMTDRQIAEALAGAPDSSLPPYLDPAQPADWPSVYPDAFRAATGPSAGYVLRETPDGIAYVVQSLRRAYDFHEAAAAQPVGLVLRTLDAKGRETRFGFDEFRLFPVEVAGATGLRTGFAHDYRLMQPTALVGPNGNRTVNSYTPLGLVAAVTRMGREGTETGDAPDRPGLRFDYDLLAYETSSSHDRRPIAVTTIQRVFHANGPFDETAFADETIRKAEYSDGFARLLQMRAETEPIGFGDATFGEGVGLPLDQSHPGAAIAATNVPDRVVVSGAVVYDTKGRVVAQFEPYFDIGLAYRPPEAAQNGRSTRMFYDAHGTLVRSIAADGAERRIVLGIPTQLSAPSEFDPTPWETYTYDANDLAPLSRAPGGAEPSETLVSRAAVEHHFTPSSTEIDAFGRTTRTVQRLGQNPGDAITTRSRYDIRGNLVELTDALGRQAFSYLYDFANRRIRTDSTDAGVRIELHDATGVATERRDGKGAVVLTAVDALDRPMDVWARDRANLAITRRQHLIYGDTAPAALLAAADALERNLLGRPFQHYDEAGRLTAHQYDFKGNILEASREVIADSVLVPAMTGPASVDGFQVDWTAESLAEAATLLDPIVYRTSLAYDALDRVIHADNPEDVEGRRRRLRTRYDHVGALQAVLLDGETIVRHIAYDAKGQRTLIAYGNGVMTRYAYDPLSLRLRRLRSERYSEPSQLGFVPAGVPLQDLAYRYDLVGNITEISDRTPQCGVPNNSDAASAESPAVAQLLARGDALIRRFAYDPIYRLASATGREHDRPPDDLPWQDEPRTTDFTRTRLYTERYAYDATGNLEQLRHVAGAGSFTRTFALQPAAIPGIAESNRLRRMTVGETSFDYAHDAAGNMLSEGVSRAFIWNHADRLKGFRVQAGDGEPSILALYLHGAAGQRVKKLVRRQGGGVQSVTYIGGGFERTREADVENDVLDIADGKTRIASIRIGPALPEDTTPARKFDLTDHLGSSTVVLDEAGGFVDREEFLPYGQTSFGRFARKRWRFGGQRRDDENGLYQHQARSYCCWTGRFLSVDPASSDHPEWPAFAFASDNPIRFVDPTGLFAEDPKEKDLPTGEAGKSSERPGGVNVDEGEINFYVSNAEEHGGYAAAEQADVWIISTNAGVAEVGKQMQEALDIAREKYGQEFEVGTVFIDQHGAYARSRAKVSVWVGGKKYWSKTNSGRAVAAGSPGSARLWKSKLAPLRDVLSPSSEVVFSACNLAGGKMAGKTYSIGELFIDDLSDALGATVYANKSWSGVGSESYNTGSDEIKYLSWQNLFADDDPIPDYLDRTNAYNWSGIWARATPGKGLRVERVNALYLKSNGGFGIADDVQQSALRTGIEIQLMLLEAQSKTRRRR